MESKKSAFLIYRTKGYGISIVYNSLLFARNIVSRNSVLCFCVFNPPSFEFVPAFEIPSDVFVDGVLLVLENDSDRWVLIKEKFHSPLSSWHCANMVTIPFMNVWNLTDRQSTFPHQYNLFLAFDVHPVYCIQVPKFLSVQKMFYIQLTYVCWKMNFHRANDSTEKGNEIFPFNATQWMLSIEPEAHTFLCSPLKWNYTSLFNSIGKFFYDFIPFRPYFDMYPFRYSHI